jgi:hypothetical protein
MAVQEKFKIFRLETRFSWPVRRPEIFTESQSGVNPFLTFKSFWVYTILAALLVPSIACTYKPAYLQQERKAQVPERWKVEKVNPPLLSRDEKFVYETMGAPQFIRFYRRLSPDREKVYAWVYTEPVRFVTFLDGKKIDYVVLDDDPSSLNQYQRKRLLWGGITAGAVVGLGAVLYYFLGKK